MRRIGTSVRWLLGLQAFACLTVGASGLWPILRTGIIPETESPYAAAIRLAILCYLLAAGLLTAAAVWHMPSGVRALGLAASVVNLPLIPVGTVAGIAGLFYFSKQRPPLPRGHRPVAGDGTSRLSQVLWFAGQYLWLIIAYEPLRTILLERGLVSAPWNWASLLVGGVAVYTAILIHECGHYFAGRAAGFRLLTFRVGALDWRRSGGRWKFRIEWSGLIGGGHTGMAPDSPDRLRERAMELTAGGPAGSLICGLAACALLLAVAGPSCPPLAGRFLLLLTVIAVGDCLFNLYPASSGVGYSDGARLWQLAKRGPWAEYMCASYYMTMSMAGPIRPRDWPSQLVTRAADFGRDLPAALGTFALAYTHFEDLGDSQRAAEYLALAESRTEKGTKAERDFAMERAYFNARHLDDPAAGLGWLQSAREDDTADYWRTRAAVHAVGGDLDAARYALGRGWAILSAMPATGIYDMGRRQFDDLRLKIDSAELVA